MVLKNRLPITIQKPVEVKTAVWRLCWVSKEYKLQTIQLVSNIESFAISSINSRVVGLQPWHGFPKKTNQSKKHEKAHSTICHDQPANVHDHGCGAGGYYLLLMACVIGWTDSKTR